MTKDGCKKYIYIVYLHSFIDLLEKDSEPLSWKKAVAKRIK